MSNFKETIHGGFGIGDIVAIDQPDNYRAVKYLYVVEGFWNNNGEVYGIVHRQVTPERKGATGGAIFRVVRHACSLEIVFGEEVIIL